VPICIKWLGHTFNADFHTADITALPFGDGCFDVVVSSVAIHNVEGGAGRDRAIEEAVRVLRPGGRLLIADIWATGRYRTHLSELGMIDVARRGLGWRMWWSGPWLSTRLVTATKPLIPLPTDLLARSTNAEESSSFGGGSGNIQSRENSRILRQIYPHYSSLYGIFDCGSRA
jgi:SAM-dependent methyltransferase